MPWAMLLHMHERPQLMSGLVCHSIAFASEHKPSVAKGALCACQACVSMLGDVA